MAQIDKPTDYFNTVLYTGNGSARSITGVGHQPDWVWIKSRSATWTSELYDAVRGATKSITTSTTAAEGTDAQDLTAFNADGFSLGTNGGINNNSDTYASWNWKANGQGSSNTDGSINTTYTSVNTTAGFSIVKWTGSNANATIGHGLGAVPKMIIFKNLATATSWMVYHVTQGATKFLRLNETAAVGTGSTPFNNTEPTSSVFSVGANGDTNGNSQAMIAYCFAEKRGYSKFGSYTGNGNANGPFIYTGFKPAFLMYKRTAGTSDWVMVDNKRDPINVCDEELYANLDAAAGTTDLLDFTSNGFKCRRSHTSQNANGETYIYMAFAENPIVGSNNTPATAR
jgi:hypothetical protein